MSRMRPLLLLALSGCPAHAPAWYDFTTANLETSTGSTGTTDTTGDTSAGGSSTGSTSGQAGDEGSGSGTMASSSSSSTSTGDDTSGSTSGAPGICGDGVVDPGEECDDGNAEHDDRCDAFCFKNRIVFATRDGIHLDWLGGIEGADNLCRQYANKAGHAGWLSFRAWLSDSNTHAGERLYPGLGRYLRPDGVVVVQDGAQFLSGQLDAPIAADEYGDPVGGGVWTGTRPDGTAYPGSSHCSDWTMIDFFQTGLKGNTALNDGGWTQYPDPEINPAPCAGPGRLYCIEGE